MKFHGKIGFWEGDVETTPGVWQPQITERYYTGDILRNARRNEQATGQMYSNLKITNQFSILSDLYMRENLDSILYIDWSGAKWAVSSITMDYPRITFEIGGVYNGEASSGTPSDPL